MSRLDPLLKTLGAAPENEIPAHLTDRIRRLVDCTNEIVATELTEIRDACVFEGSCSSFAINVLTQAIEVAKVKD